MTKQCLEFVFAVVKERRGRDWSTYEALGDLLDRCIEALPVHGSELVLACIHFPLSFELDQGLMVNRWPNPSTGLHRFPRTEVSARTAADDARIAQLLTLAQTGVGRDAVIVRLRVLLLAGLLSRAEIDALGEAIWHVVDDGDPPLPAEIPYYKHILLDLPHPASVNVDGLLRARLHRRFRHGAPETDSLNDIYFAAIRSDKRCVPDPDFASGMLDDCLARHPRLLAWLEYNEDHEEPGTRRRRLGRVIGRVLLPSMGTEDLTSTRYDGLVAYMVKEQSTEAVAGFPYFAEALKERQQEIYHWIIWALMRPHHSEVGAGAHAIVTWFREPRLRAMLTVATQAHLCESLLAALGAGRLEGLDTMIDAAKAVQRLGEFSSMQTIRLAHLAQQILESTSPHNIEPQSEAAGQFSLARAAVARLANELCGSEVPEVAELARALAGTLSADPLPEVRFAIPQQHSST
jgi:hypothetical protein